MHTTPTLSRLAVGLALLAGLFFAIERLLGGTAIAQPAVDSDALKAHLTWVTPEISAPGVSFRTFESAAAKATVSHHVYAPPAYDRERERRFPVVYWLHGSGGGLPRIPKVAGRCRLTSSLGRVPAGGAPRRCSSGCMEATRGISRA